MLQSGESASDCSRVLSQDNSLSSLSTRKSFQQASAQPKTQSYVTILPSLRDPDNKLSGLPIRNGWLQWESLGEWNIGCTLLFFLHAPQLL